MELMVIVVVLKLNTMKYNFKFLISNESCFNTHFNTVDSLILKILWVLMSSEKSIHCWSLHTWYMSTKNYEYDSILFIFFYTQCWSMFRTQFEDHIESTRKIDCRKHFQISTYCPLCESNSSPQVLVILKNFLQHFKIFRTYKYL